MNRFQHSRLVLKLLGLMLGIQTVAFAGEFKKHVQALASDDPESLEVAAKELLKTPDESTPELISALKSTESPEGRMRILRVMAKIKNHAVIKSAGEIAVDDKQWMVRLEAIGILGRNDSGASKDLLQSIARQDVHRMNRAAAIRWLSYMRKNASAKFIKDLLNDKEPLVRVEAARELGRHGDDSGFKTAKELIGHPDIHIRSSAIEAIGLIGREDGMSLIKPVAESASEHQHARFAAIRSMKQIEFKKVAMNRKMAFLADALADNSWAIRNWAMNELRTQYDANPTQVQAILKPILENPKHAGYEQAFQLDRMIKLGHEK